MFVTTEDYNVPPFDLPNLTAVVNSFADFVTEQEEEWLSKLLGVRFWEAMKAGIEALPEDWDAEEEYAIDDLVVYTDKIYKALQVSTGVTPISDPASWVEQPEDRWLVLKLGATYTYLGVEYSWLGMNALTKPLIYSLWLECVVNDQVSGTGNVKAKSENSDVVSPNFRICKSWNKYNDLACGRLTNGTRMVYYQNSLYGYLLANFTDFDDVVAPDYANFQDYLAAEFCDPGRKNVLDL